MSRDARQNCITPQGELPNACTREFKGEIQIIILVHAKILTQRMIYICQCKFESSKHRAVLTISMNEFIYIFSLYFQLG